MRNRFPDWPAGSFCCCCSRSVDGYGRCLLNYTAHKPSLGWPGVGGGGYCGQLGFNWEVILCISRAGSLLRVGGGTPIEPKCRRTTGTRFVRDKRPGLLLELNY